MNREDLRDRTKRFAVQVIHFLRSLPKSIDGQVLGKQLIRSATSVAANYRAAGRARSTAEFVSKLSIVVEEADETLFWLELIQDSESSHGTEIESLKQEAKELLYIFSSSRKTARASATSANHQITR